MGKHNQLVPAMPIPNLSPLAYTYAYAPSPFCGNGLFNFNTIFVGLGADPAPAPPAGEAFGVPEDAAAACLGADLDVDPEDCLSVLTLLAEPWLPRDLEFGRSLIGPERGVEFCACGES